MKRTAVWLILLPLLVLAEEEQGGDGVALAEYGHSAHGEVFNEGPRQAAVLIPGTGEVGLEITTSSPEARAFFQQGLGQIHGFWDFEAERSFRQAAALDPECAMAYWGMAMANFKNDTRGKAFIEEAVSRRDLVSEEEKMWIDGLGAYFKDTKADSKKRLRDFVRSLEEIADEHPDNIEAQAFILKQIYYNHGKGLPIPSHYVVNLLAEQILNKDPLHPANHYQIHIWDREDPAKALAAAARCGPAAPAIAHMWHMPGHIYSRLHRYADAAWQQEASARVDHAHMIRYQLVPDQIHNFAHNNEWLVRNLNALGQRDRSIELAVNMISLPRLAKFKKKNDESTYESKGSSWHHGRQRLRDTLVRFEMWEDLIRHSEGGLLEVDGESIAEVEHHRFVGIARFETGDYEEGVGHLKALETLLAGKTAERDEAVADAEKKAVEGKKSEKEIEAAKKAASEKFQAKITELENPVRELTVYRHLSAAPPRTEEARVLLPDLKNLAKWRHAALWQRAGGKDEAEKIAAEAVGGAKNEVLPLATQVSILHVNGKTEEARKAFETLRTVGHRADLDLRPFAPLAAVAEEFEFPEDWRREPEPAADLGERPSLDSLGPFRWTPPPASEFALPDAEGTLTRLSDYSGRPVLVIYYLGRGCTHCMEQLNAFAPLQEDYAEAGIEIVTVSTDSVEGLGQTFRDSDEGENPFPFVMLSDESLDAFKAARAYDDFEGMPLHGTFLIDGSGSIRWQNISYEPFMHATWLLEECRRLLSPEVSESLTRVK